MKIIIEGEISEMQGVLAALLASSATVTIPTDTPVVEPEAETPEIAVVEEDADNEVIAEPAEVSDEAASTIIDRVMRYIENNPGATNTVMSHKLGLTLQQVQTATKKLHLCQKITKMVDRSGHTPHIANWIASALTKSKKAPNVTAALMHYVRMNPKSTSAFIAEHTGIPYPKITAIMSNLMRQKRIAVEGKGGILDPYRYSANKG